MDSSETRVLDDAPGVAAADAQGGAAGDPRRLRPARAEEVRHDAARPRAGRARPCRSTRRTSRRTPQVCGFPRKDTLPLPYLHMLAFPLHMAMMTDRVVPVPGDGHGAPREHHHPAPRRSTGRGAVRRERVAPRTCAAHAKGTGLRPADRGHGRRRGRVGGGLDVPPPRHGRRGRRPRAWSSPVVDATAASTGASAATSAGATPRCPATATRSTSTPRPPRPSASRARSRTACGARPAASPRVENRLPDAVRVEVAFKTPVLLPTVRSLRLRPPTDARDDRTCGLGFSLVNPRNGAPAPGRPHPPSRASTR